MPRGAVRDHLVRALYADAIGPFVGREAQETSTEVLEIAPSRFYLTGFLAPREDRETEDATSEEGFEAGSDQDEEESTGTEDEPKQKKQFPASMGLSVFLRAGGRDEIEVKLSFATYSREREEKDDGKKGPYQWRRTPWPPIVFSVPLDAQQLTRPEGIVVPGASKLRIRGKLETVSVGMLPAGTRALALFLVNEGGGSEKGKRDEDFLFQVEMELHYSHGFEPRPNRRGERSDQWDENVADLQFRKRVEYGVGHNVSVDTVDEGAELVTRVRTSWMPRAEVRRVMTRAVDAVTTSMSALGAMESGSSLRSALEALPREYAKWIGEQRDVAVDSKDREDTKTQLLYRAELAQKRIAAGIEVLATDETARTAFVLMNRAMASAAERQGRPDAEWHLFQLAFVLLNVPSTVDPHHVDRETVELIFFPTGGGKTEAYLGLIAFTLFLRRFRGLARPDGGLGVAVLLRYTLRLLTLDQLGRASTLMCAMERIRKERPKELGGARFTVGLWVGRSATANTMSEVAEKLSRYRRGQGASPFPLTKCPWCGTEIKADSFDLRPDAKKPRRIIVRCTNFRDCDFSVSKEPDGLPVLFVDEQIYRELPGFLVATVDKFAMMPWRGEIGMLFGRAFARSGSEFFGPLDRKLPRDAVRLPEHLHPPELIVQDELHLISGPLGTMVGLYETAVETLATRSDARGAIKPKIVASTATVRAASQQITALFGRSATELFPPPGIDEGETFFSEVDRESPGRLYVGFAAPGRPLKQILLRSYVALLSAAQHQYRENSIEADAYMTLVGYFNSLRELGGMRRLVEDQVRAYAEHQVTRRPNDAIGENPWFANRTVREPCELTSRKSSDEIKETKRRLESAFAKDGDVDVVLASNMISVGIDIDRLGMMVVAGQPKTTSEYIQASSRVGRKPERPGLVVTCFNLVKPRDRSHYERFSCYHQAFYRDVEANSLTPFAGPALERGLVGSLVAMARLLHPELTPPEAAMKVAEHRAKLDATVDALRHRASVASSREGAAEVEQAVTARVKNILDAWTRLVASAREDQATRIYSPFDVGGKDEKPILRTVLDDDPYEGEDAGKFVAPTSMRDVEETAHLWLTVRLPPKWEKR